MPVREIEIVVRGQPGSGAYSAAQSIAQALAASGASVDLQTGLAPAEDAGSVLRGVRALVTVEVPALPSAGIVSLPSPVHGQAPAVTASLA